MKTTRTIMMIFSILYFFLGGCKNKSGIDGEYYKIAKRVAQQEGILLDESKMYLDRDNVEWNKTLDYLNTNSPDYTVRFNELSGKDYQAIKIFPKEKLTFGGVLWVLIDKKTKEVIMFHGEK